MANPQPRDKISNGLASVADESIRGNQAPSIAIPNGHEAIVDGIFSKAQTLPYPPFDHSKNIPVNGIANSNQSVVNGVSKDYPHAPNGSTFEDQVLSNVSASCSRDEILPIAVIGVACRFPGGSSNPEKLWEMLANEKSAWSKIRSDRFTQSSFEHPSSAVGGTFNAKGAHFLDEDISLFDAPAFNISSIEARAMDPQMRLQLEVTYESLENGGITLEQVAGSNTAVYIGVFSDDYSNMMLSDPESLPPHHVTGTGKAIFANRISYCFDLKGPSLALDTGCSASLVALHLACQSIRSGESDQAIVGGVNLILNPTTMLSLGGLGFLSDEGRCYSFDSRGSGYGRGEGVASVVLKPLKDAIANGDPIRAVIRNTVVNQDGKTPGLTMPSSRAQINLMRDAYTQAGIDPAHTQYVEAHGTGTKAGDPIEVDAIATVLSRSRDPSDPLVIGSVKANIGHLESASGLAGLIKAILCLEKGMIPANINLEFENPDLFLSERNLKVAKELLQWPSSALRRASVNSFGYGGTNAHVILDAHQPNVPPGSSGDKPLNRGIAVNINDHNIELFQSTKQQKRIVLLSHRTKTGLQRSADNLQKYIKSSVASPNTLDDIAYTITSRRTMFSHRCAIMAASLQELQDALEPQRLDTKRVLQDHQLAFIFTGQGAQWNAMGRELLERYEIFRSTLRSADSYLRLLGAPWSVIHELLKDAASSRINSAIIGQPSCTAIQCALVDLLASWNLKPASVTGHSSGEIAAAYACGSLTLKSAMIVSYHRGLVVSMQLEQNTKLRGGMLAAGLSEVDAEVFLKRIPAGMGKAVVACVNSPRSVTLSGDRSAIMCLRSMLEARQIFVRKLGVGTAYHSHHMEIVAHSYLVTLQEQLPDPKPNEQTRFFSSVTAEPMKGEMLDAAYWVKNMVSPVKFSHSLQQMYGAFTTDGPGKHSSFGAPATQILLEIGPHPALAGPVKQTLSSVEGPAFKHMATLIRGHDAVDTMLTAATDLAVSGCSINLEAVNTQDDGRLPRVLRDLPPYPWDHSSSYWHESRLSLDYRKRSAPRHPLLGAPTPDFNRLEPSWRNVVRVSELPWLSGHVVQSNIVYPAAGYIAMAIEASSQHSRLDRPTEVIARYKLKHISIIKPMLIPGSAAGIETQLVLRPYNRSTRKSSDVWNEFRVFSCAKNNDWSEHCRGLVAVQYHQDVSQVEKDRETRFKQANYATTIAEAKDTCQNVASPVKVYESLRRIGLHFEGAFQCIEDVRCSAEQSLGHVRIPNTADVMPAGIEHPHVLHPATLDACMQMTSPILLKAAALDTPMVPTFVEEIVVSNDVPREAGKRLLVHTNVNFVVKRSIKAKITANGEDAQQSELPYIEINGLVCTAIPGGFAPDGQTNQAREKCHRIRWDAIADDSIDTQLTLDLAPTAIAKCGKSPNVFLIQPAELGPSSQSIRWSLSTLLDQRLVRSFSSLEETASANLMGGVCICLIDMYGSVLKELTEYQWLALKNILSSACNVLWVTQGGSMSVRSPEAGLISGIARAARSENAALRLVTIDIDPAQTSFDRTARSILSILDKVFRFCAAQTPSMDMEFVERDGRVYVPRVVEDYQLQRHLTAGTTEPETQAQPFIQRTRPLHLKVATPGLLDSLRFVEDTTALAPPAPNQLKMLPKCYGVNFRDVMIALGQLENTSLMSSEHSGVVTEVGSDLKESFQVGDRICAWGGRAYSSSISVDGSAAHRIPDDMGFETAASIPVVYATVYYSLVHLARLQKGERVLIHSAAGGVGQAAIMLAKYLEATIFVTVGSSEKKALIVSKYGIREEQIFSSRHLSFSAGIKRLTGGKGVDVVLNSIAGEAFYETFNCLGRLGRFIEIGKRDILEGTRLDMRTFDKNITFASVDLSIVFQHDPDLAKRMIGKVFSLLKEGHLQPFQPLNILPLSNIEGAFRLIQAGKHTGKVILKVEEDTIVKALPPPMSTATLDKNASYLIVGGLGGLGQAICRWMASRGCKNIITLSRSGTQSVGATSLKDELERIGVKLAVYACNVSNHEEVDHALGSAAQQMPPIKGLIHSAMVIRDNLISNMTHSDYQAALSPKVQGTLNLHHALRYSVPLDFFIMLSSCVGIIGNSGQANYASACTFQDAFARHRTSLGLPTRSLDLGMIEGAGYVSQNPEVLRFLTTQGFQPVTLDELFAAIDYAITQPIQDIDDCQLIIGLTGSGGSGASPVSSSPSFSDPRFENLRPAGNGIEDKSQPQQSSLRTLLETAKSASQIQGIVREAIVVQVSKVLVVPVEDVNTAMPFSHYGGDSLAAVEMRNWFARSLDAAVGVMEILSGRSLNALAAEVVGRSGLTDRE